MKTLKPFMLVLAGMAIAFLISFKNEEPKKEYLSVVYLGGSYTIMYPNEVKKIPYPIVSSTYPGSILLNENKIFNDLATEGWVLKTYGTGIASLGSQTVYYFERTKS